MGSGTGLSSLFGANAFGQEQWQRRGDLDSRLALLSAGGPAGVLAQVFNDNTQTTSGTTELVLMTASNVAVAAGRVLRISHVERDNSVTVVADAFRYMLYRDGAFLRDHLVRVPSNPTGGTTWFTTDTPPAGTHTYEMRAYRLAGTGTMTFNGFSGGRLLTVEDITPTPAASVNAALDDSGWITLPLLNSWVSYDTNYGPPRYRRVRGVVYVQGLMKNGTLGVAVAQLPAGFRPNLGTGPGNLLFTTQGAAGVTRLDVQSDGQIIGAAVTAAWTSLTGITFPADQ